MALAELWMCYLEQRFAKQHGAFWVLPVSPSVADVLFTHEQGLMHDFSALSSPSLFKADFSLSYSSSVLNCNLLIKYNMLRGAASSVNAHGECSQHTDPCTLFQRVPASNTLSNDHLTFFFQGCYLLSPHCVPYINRLTQEQVFA